MNCVSNFIQAIVNCIVTPIKKVSTMIYNISFICKGDNPLKRVKHSDEEMDIKKVFRKRISYSNLNEEFKEELKEVESKIPVTNSKLILSIDDRTPFIQNKKSKTELREKMELIDNHMYVKCKYCGNEVKDREIFLMYDKHYCSEVCRHRMLFKK